MSDKYKHSEQFEEVLRYLNNTMTDQERYNLEKEFERDPFLYEAYEGLSEHKSSEIDRDIRNMDVIAGKRRISLGFLKYIGYAAGFAIMVLGGYWAVKNIHFPKSEMTVVAKDTTDQKFREPYKPVKHETNDSVTGVDSAGILVAQNNLSQTTIGSTNKATTIVTVDDQGASTGQNAKSKELTRKKGNMANVPEKTLKAEEEVVSQPVAVSEVTNIETQPAETTTEQVQQDDGREDIEEPLNALKRPGVNALPQPLGGGTLFRNYLDQNTHYPSGSKSTRKEFVKIRFKISRTGEPHNFVIEKSPGASFSEEAVRVIKNGPKWSPEIKDGIPVVGEVTVKVNFKPETK